jgi:hypothetical protein
MNCVECRDQLVACLEGLLEGESARLCRAHLETCPACRGEHDALAQLQSRLVANGKAAAEVSLVFDVMRAVQNQQNKPEKIPIMKRLSQYRWPVGLGLAAGAAALVLLFGFLTPQAQATAADVLARGAKALANLTTIHFKAQVRTYPADNFATINPNVDFQLVEVWEQYAPDLKWRVEKPGRVALMDGQQALLFIKSAKMAAKFPGSTRSAYDTDWLHRIANLSSTISNELRMAQAKGWELRLGTETGHDARLKSVVTVTAKSGLAENDYLHNKFFEVSDTRRVYRFDDQTEHLEAVQIYLTRASGDVLILDLNQIEYDQPIAPTVWHIDLPGDVVWDKPLEKLPDNEKYASMSAEQAARAFFEGCGREDWNEVAKYQGAVTERLKEYLGGLELVSLGQSFTSKAYPGVFIPYEIKLRPQEINMRVSNNNPSKRYVITGVFDSKLQEQEPLKWSTPPASLAAKDPYATISPAELVKASYAAFMKFDWAELEKSAPIEYIEKTKKEFADAEKQGINPRNFLPVVEVGEATWSPQHSAYFVKCKMTNVKKWNLAIRKDNPAGRWQVDGGI